MITQTNIKNAMRLNALKANSNLGGSNWFGPIFVRAGAGYTLLELLLALALTVVVITAIGSAIHVNLYSLGRTQDRIERKQVARSILALIQNDIRAGIQYKSNDYSGLTDLVTSLEQVAGQDLGQLPGNEEDSETEIQPTDADLTPEQQLAQLEQQDIEDEQSFPAFIGSTDFLTLNISRLPRLDQYSPLIPSVTDDVSTISDVKMVSFFVSGTDGGIESSIGLSKAELAGGLYRREVDRSIASFAGMDQSIKSPDRFSKLLASEVVRANFRYFDGQQWQESWNSGEDGGFPLAVELVIVLDPTRTPGRVPNGFTSDIDEQFFETYRSVVNLPVAEVSLEEESE